MLHAGEVVGAFEVSYVRMLFALAAVWLIGLVRGHIRETARARKNTEAMGLIFGGAFVGPFLGVWLSLVAVSLIPAGIAATLNAMAPVLVIPLVVLVYKEKVTMRATVGAIVAVGGVALPWCTTRDLGPQLSCTRGFEVPHEHFQTHSAEVCEEGLSREELS